MRNPQRELFEALRARLADEEVDWEVSGLVPGRRFRVDIYLPASRIAAEMDGFAYHRSKRAFQRDRERQNLLIAQNILVLRYVAAQVFSEKDRVVEQVLQLHQSRINPECTDIFQPSGSTTQ